MNQDISESLAPNVTDDFSSEVWVKSDRSQVFKALTSQIDKWWSTVDHEAERVGDIFKISFGGESYWRFQVLDSNPDGQITWQCIESNQDHNLKGIDEEWINTKLYWEFVERDNGVKIRFTHKGLRPEERCYDVCSKAWEFYIADSLKSFLEEGLGKPNGN